MTPSSLSHDDNRGYKHSIESLYANEISELWDLLEEYAKSSKKNSSPSLRDTSYTFNSIEPPFTMPRAVRDLDSIVTSIMAHVQRTLDDVEVEVAINVHNHPEELTYELTDIYGKDQYVQTVNKKVVDRSQTTSKELHEMLVGLALTREEKITLRLAEAAGVNTLLSKLGAMSPLIEAGLANNAQSIRSTDYYDFVVDDPDTGEFLDVTMTHSSVKAPFGVVIDEDNESFAVNVTWVKQDGGVKKVGLASLEISHHVDPDSDARKYVLDKEAGRVEITDEDFIGSTDVERLSFPEIIQIISHAFNTETASQVVFNNRIKNSD